MHKACYKLMLVTQKSGKKISEYLDFLKVCVQNGVTAVQLREKNLSGSELFEFACHLKNFLSEFNVPLIINDHLELALEVGADGLHLGQDDGHIVEARERLGPHSILGLTINGFDQLQKANELPVDYLGVGAIFPTKNKPDVENIWGCKSLRQAVLQSRHKILAIGGIHLMNIEEVINTGVYGIAAIGAFHDAYAPGEVARALHHHIGI